MKKISNNPITFIMFICITWLQMDTPVEASYVLAGPPKLEIIFQIGFSVVLGIVILAVILLIYSKASLSNIKRKKKEKSEEDFF